MIDCKKCKHGIKEFCCNGCEIPRLNPWVGSCLHYEKMEKTNQDFYNQGEAVIDLLDEEGWTIHESVLILQIALESARGK